MAPSEAWPLSLSPYTLNGWNTQILLLSPVSWLTYKVKKREESVYKLSPCKCQEEDNILESAEATHQIVNAFV